MNDIFILYLKLNCSVHIVYKIMTSFCFGPTCSHSNTKIVFPLLAMSTLLFHTLYSPHFGSLSEILFIIYKYIIKQRTVIPLSEWGFPDPFSQLQKISYLFITPIPSLQGSRSWFSATNFSNKRIKIKIKNPNPRKIEKIYILKTNLKLNLSSFHCFLLLFCWNVDLPFVFIFEKYSTFWGCLGCKVNLWL